VVSFTPELKLRGGGEGLKQNGNRLRGKGISSRLDASPAGLACRLRHFDEGHPVIRPSGSATAREKALASEIEERTKRLANSRLSS
jgi:hypothetical protein